MGPGYKAPAAPSFAGPAPGSTGLMPWLRQGTSPLQAQGSMANMLRSPQPAGGQPWYQGQMDTRNQQFGLQEQQRQAAILQKQQEAAAAAALAAQVPQTPYQQAQAAEKQAYLAQGGTEDQYQILLGQGAFNDNTDSGSGD